MNTLNRNSVREAVLAALREFLGDNCPDQVSEATDPFKDLGLDSEDGVDFACVLSEKFGCLVPNDVNPFVDDARHCPRLVSQIIDLMCGLLQKANL